MALVAGYWRGQDSASVGRLTCRGDCRWSLPPALWSSLAFLEGRHISLKWYFGGYKTVCESMTLREAQPMLAIVSHTRIESSRPTPAPAACSSGLPPLPTYYATATPVLIGTTHGSPEPFHGS